jgi:hypothetical protein
MKFIVRFRVGGRLGAGSTYTLREICVSLVNRYDLKEKEICEIVALPPGGKFSNADLEVARVGLKAKPG